MNVLRTDVQLGGPCEPEHNKLNKSINNSLPHQLIEWTGNYHEFTAVSRVHFPKFPLII